MYVSQETKQRLIRYALAVRQYEETHRKVYYKDGSYLDIGPSPAAVDEKAAAKQELYNSPEPEIRKFLLRMNSENGYTVMLAENELVALGWMYKDGKTEIKPRLRRSRRYRSRTRCGRICYR